MINREHKDRLFSFIFGSEGNKAWALSLYNAVNGTGYDDPDQIGFNTIQNVLYMSMKNDVSMIVRATMNLYAHQSTYNPNMPLRELMYAGLLYDKYVHEHSLNIYGRKRIEIPIPRIVVFYNGTDDTDDEVTLRLSDSFPEGSDPGKSDIQVRAHMLNINYGRNRELLEKCKPLMEYAWLVSEIRKNRKDEMTIEDAVDKALDEMPDRYEIKSFLLLNKAEVKAMCLTEYNEEETMEKFREEGREEEREDLLQIAISEGMLTSEQANQLRSIRSNTTAATI